MISSGASTTISNSPRSMEEAPPSPRRHRSRRCVLPEDALYEILLRLPAKDLCRLRAVCRPWRSLLSDPHFIDAHAARHPDPLVVVGCEDCEQNGPVLCDVVDLSGRIVKRVRAAGHDDGSRTNYRWVRFVMCTHADLVCVADYGMGMSCQLLNLATGAVHDLPDGVAAQVQEQEDITCYCTWIVFGLVPSTGEYKVLRMVEVEYLFGNPGMVDEVDDFDHPAASDHCEILTIDGSSPATSWRGTHAAPYDLELSHSDSSAVIGGVVYFMLSYYYWDHHGTELGVVGSFDLEAEKWRSSIRGPSSSGHHATLKDIKIAALSGHLALCCRTYSSSMDIWFLTDFHNGSWVKQHSIRVSLFHVPNVAQPLLMLKDEGIAGHNENWAFLENYNKKIDIIEQQMKRYVGLYGGNLLSLANGTT